MSLLLALVRTATPPTPDEEELVAAGAHDWRKYSGISADVAKALQAKKGRTAPVVAPTEAETAPIAAPEVAPIPEAPSVEVTAIQAILDAWQRIEDRQAAEAQELAAQEIARIQALQDEELMIVTMIAALA